MLAFFYDLITGRAGKTRLILEGVAVVFLVLMTIAVGIRPPAPPVPSERN